MKSHPRLILLSVVVLTMVVATWMMLSGRGAPASVVAGDPAPKAAPPAREVTASRGVTLDQVPPQYRKQVESVIEAQRTRSHPERLGISFAPTRFDAARFAADPRSYLDVVEPGRVYDTAMGTGPESVALEIEGEGSVVVPEGGSAVLKVKGVPRAPVSFTSTAGGHFDNRISYITVLADDQGLASVTFTADRTADDIQILAGSPRAVGTVSLIVHALYEHSRLQATLTAGGQP